ncbi:Alpha-ketoglutaric semialdehyde dehydrogenase [Armadillidium vulgare]|nr:Alpha-ketoglutaric semialdehyde dehydrogenase [Armadillidium vulgare]
MITGKSLINGQWFSSDKTFHSIAAKDGRELEQSYAVMGKTEADLAAQAAEAAFLQYAGLSDIQRAGFLDAAADAIETIGEEITEVAVIETGLPEARLNGERGRTTGQLRMFANYIRAGHHRDTRIDQAQPDRAPLPRPDLRLTMRPIGPVVVFGASNFPLAFSTAGGDTASVLAAGCPVIVKGHPGHPGTGELVAQALLAAVNKCGLPDATFQFLQSNQNELGEALVSHPLVSAVGFTGSLRAGRALFDRAVSREVPIPFYGELGSVNPVLLFPHALEARGDEIAKGWAASLTMGAWQFCTNPGIVVALKSPAFEAFCDRASEALGGVDEQTMLNPSMAKSYNSAIEERSASSKLGLIAGGDAPASDCAAKPAMYRATASDWLDTHAIQSEVFGPSAIIVECQSDDELKRVVSDLEGQLTITLQLDEGDHAQAAGLLPVLERKAGRLLVNGFPTGVEVANAMMHGGPYPASTDVRATSVGTRAINRFLRPVSYQNFPNDLLPEAIKGQSAPGVRLVTS